MKKKEQNIIIGSVVGGVFALAGGIYLYSIRDYINLDIVDDISFSFSYDVKLSSTYFIVNNDTYKLYTKNINGFKFIVLENNNKDPVVYFKIKYINFKPEKNNNFQLVGLVYKDTDYEITITRRNITISRLY